MFSVALLSIAIVSICIKSQKSQAERELVSENIEALTEGEEGVSISNCYFESIWTGEMEWGIKCDYRTTMNTIYSCNTSQSCFVRQSVGSCIK